MILSQTDQQTLYDAFLASVAHLGSVEQKLAVLFTHSLRSPEEQQADRETWVDALRTTAADALALADANIASEKTRLGRLREDLDAIKGRLRTSTPVKVDDLE